MTAETGASKPTRLSSSLFDSYNLDTQNTALKATKLAVALPVDINFHRTIDSDFAEVVAACSAKTLKLTNSLLELSETSYASSPRVKGKQKLEDQEDVVDSFGSLVVDVLDQLFERVDMGLDDLLGRNKPTAVPVKAPPASAHKMLVARIGRLEPSVLHAAHLRKPQLNFRRRVDNSNGYTWVPKLKHKYNAQIPLGFSLYGSADDTDIGTASSQHSHPYFYEIKHISYPLHMFEHRDPMPPSSFENTPFTWIDTKEGLEILLEKLRLVREIAVDLEHHSYRSFSGFLCLMQISTHEEDFILDTLALRDELEDLNEIFTDPRIVKILHGADSDIVWLQQDFNIYIVNLFDTYHASKILDFPRHGLGALLEMYCDFVPDKRYQLADWRIRPLPDEMLQYARADTHFLLYVYNNLRNALLDRERGQPQLVQVVLDRSQETALRVYESEVYDLENGTGAGGSNALAEKWGRVLSGMQGVVFRAVHAWRDAVARSEDESTRYVLPNHYLFQLAERTPADMASLLAIFRPVPPLVRTKAASLLEVIRKAVKEASSGPETGLESSNVHRSHTSVNKAREGLPPTSKSHEASVLSENTSRSAVLPPSELWARKCGGLTTSSSSLLGTHAGAGGFKLVDRLSARSTLFPKGWISNESASNVIDSALSRYQEVVSRIHTTLVIAPSIPKASIVMPQVKHAERDVTSSNDAVSPPASPVRSEQIEVPFVPKNERQSYSIVPKIESDTITTVGRIREKKRKRPKQAGTADFQNADIKKPRGEATDGHGVEAVEPTEEFDYDSAPNVLDGPITDQSVLLKPQKGKLSKGRVAFEYGNFPAPPRAYNTVRGANVSQTFK